METLIPSHTATLLQQEIAWIETVIATALALHFQHECAYASIEELPPPAVVDDHSGYAHILKEYPLSPTERLLLVLALLPHVKPQALDVFLTKNKDLDREFSEFGGIQEASQRSFIPTLATANFILGGADNLDIRLRFMKTLHKGHRLYKNGILHSEQYPIKLWEKLQLSDASLNLIITGQTYLPTYNSKFPAQQVSTALTWDDLVLENHRKEQLYEIQQWLTHSDRILNTWKLNTILKKGYRALFYGPPGTGKTLAANLLGKATDRPVFRIDLAMMVSKYIGETEKNLGRLFDEAASKAWILFFDEADALFGKRTQTNTSNDRYANQEVAYLLQRIEDFDGLVILATNLQTNLDEAFLRRFQSTVHFPKPQYKERKRLWEQLIGNVFDIEEGPEVLDTIAKDYELAGGEMINVVRYCALQAAQKGEKKINKATLMTGIKREYHKANKTFH